MCGISSIAFIMCLSCEFCMFFFRRQEELESKLIEEETTKRVEELVAMRVEEELRKRKDEIEAEVLRRVEEVKQNMEKQMLEELERKRAMQEEEEERKKASDILIYIFCCRDNCLSVVHTIHSNHSTCYLSYYEQSS